MKRGTAVVFLTAAAAGLGGTGCTSSVASAPVNVWYAVTVSSCSSGCKVVTASGLTSAMRGDTLLVSVSVVDTVTDDSALVLVRGNCDTGLNLIKGRTVVRSWPTTVTCPDSVISKYVAPGRSDVRGYVWVVDPALAAGSYRFDGKALITPGLSASAPFQIN